MFNPIRKSCYNGIDMQIYQEAKTIVPIGLLCPQEVLPDNILKQMLQRHLQAQV